MARIRTIKPEFFLHEGMAELSPVNRLLFIGLWTLADRQGRLEDRPKRIKASIFPYEEADVDAMLATLDEAGHIHRYEASGEAYIDIPGFSRHQRPHPKETSFALPEPPSREKKRQAVKRFSTIPSSPAGKGREGKESLDNGKEISESHPASADQPSDPLSPSAPEPIPPIPLELLPTPVKQPDESEQVFRHWTRTMGKDTKTAFGAKRRVAVKARLAEGYSVADLCAAVDGCAKTPHNMGQNDRGERYDDLELICRNAGQVDRFREKAGLKPSLPGEPPRKPYIPAAKPMSIEEAYPMGPKLKPSPPAKPLPELAELEDWP